MSRARVSPRSQTASTSIEGWQIALHLEPDADDCVRVIDCIELPGIKLFYFLDILNAGSWCPAAVGVCRGLIGSAGGLFNSPAAMLARLRVEIGQLPVPGLEIRALGLGVHANASMIDVASVGWSHLYCRPRGAVELAPLPKLAGLVGGLSSSKSCEAPLTQLTLEVEDGGALVVCSPGSVDPPPSMIPDDSHSESDISALISLISWRDEIISGRFKKWPFSSPPLGWIRHI